jgi:hypothetical protein
MLRLKAWAFVVDDLAKRTDLPMSVRLAAPPPQSDELRPSMTPTIGDHAGAGALR